MGLGGPQMTRMAAGLFLAATACLAQTPKPGSTPPAVSPAPLPTMGALGGSYASVGISRPLGGIAPPSGPAGNSKQGKPATTSAGYRYVGPIYYVPNASDLAQYEQANPAPVQSTWQPPYAQPAYAAPAPQPVIINQYFGSARGPEQLQAPVRTDENSGPDTSAPVQPAAQYYLIQFRDRTVIQVVAYWVEGDTLHYITAPNIHNQASLSLLDLDKTAKLNAEPLR